MAEKRICPDRFVGYKFVGRIDEPANGYVIGESKSQIGKRDVDRFTKFLTRVSNHLGARLIPLLVTYSVRPEVEQYAREKIRELSLYMSFEI